MLIDLLTVATTAEPKLVAELCAVIRDMPADGPPLEPNFVRQAAWGCVTCLNLAHTDQIGALESMLSLVAEADPLVWQCVRDGLLGLRNDLGALPNEEAGTVAATLVATLVTEIDGRRLLREVNRGRDTE